MSKLLLPVMKISVKYWSLSIIETETNTHSFVLCILFVYVSIFSNVCLHQYKAAKYFFVLCMTFVCKFFFLFHQIFVSNQLNNISVRMLID